MRRGVAVRGGRDAPEKRWVRSLLARPRGSRRTPSPSRWVDALKAYYEDIDLEIGAARARLDAGQPRRALVRFARDVEGIFRREGRLMKELLTLISVVPNLRRLDDQSGARDARELRAFLDRARAAGSLRRGVPIDDVAALMDLWAGAVREWVLGNQEPSLAALYAKRIGLLSLFESRPRTGL